MKQICVLLTLAAALAASPGLADFGQTDNGAPIIPFLPVGEGGGCSNLLIDGILGSGSGDWPSVSGTQTGRLNRNGTASSCAVPKTCNQFDGTPGRAFDAYTFSNASGATACVTVTLDVITQTGCNLQVNGYTGTYDPANICTNYLADPGLSSGVPPSQISFATNVAAANDFVLVVHTTNPGEIGCEYTLTVSGSICGVDADLALGKSVAPTSVAPGDDAVFTLTATNNGPGDATNTVVTDTLPAGLTYVSNDCGGNFAAPTFTWSIGALANGASAVCNVTVTVDAEGSFPNSASISADQTDPTPGNNASAATVAAIGGVEIPTVSTAGFALLLLALGGAAVMMLRRRA